ncbi:Mgm1p [Malassezia vespertilionis]|uniref:dynamin GTPase n=2 Tax=Malassezia vespertilionis TaxID=2020962 RepID=A0A2N1JCI3_9BASI|nr:Mgm1p [Malassezia vespertilionis]
MLKMMRLPLYGATAAGGAYAYTHYKLDELKGKLNAWYGSASDAASGWYGSASDAASGWYGSASDAASGWYGTLSGTLESSRSSLGDFFGNLKSTGTREEAQDGDDGDNGGGDKNGGNNGGGDDEKGLLGAAALGAALTSDNAPSKDEQPAQGSTEDLMLLTRKLIEVRNMLQDIDQDSEELNLPSIVVIGSQSSGKSSVLESIVGHEFLPKGTNMVTRRPIELTLVHTERNAETPNGLIEYGEFPGLGMGRIADFSGIQKVLYDLNMMVSKEEGVSDDPIQLHIYSPQVPDLSLIDLPGYVQLSSMDQPEALREKIATLCDKYIREPNIILAVCAADVDLANSPALRASRKVDPLGQRTIGVVTKMDLIPPKEGAAILNNNKYPLALGYIGVVCKPPPPPSNSMFTLGRNRNVVQLTQEYEHEFFTEYHEDFSAPTHGRSAGVQPLVGTHALRTRLMVVLEESMGASLSGVAETVRKELDEASYQFKVQYNDRIITAESYVTEVIDVLKQRFKYFAHHFGKPEVRVLLKSALDDKVMDALAQMYWTDGRVVELTELGNRRRGSPEELDPVWMHKLDASTGTVTKCGVGRLSTQLVANTIRAQLEQLALAEPLNYHHETVERIVAFGTALLTERFGVTADQVENCIKPYKYEVDVDGREWEEGRKQSEILMRNELDMCNEAHDRLKKLVGGRRLRGAVEYISQLEQREKDRIAQRIEHTGDPEQAIQTLDDQNDPTRPGFNAALLMKAREARFLENRAGILHMRMLALRSRRCKAGPQSKVFCPETFLDVVADKLTQTAVMFINIELLAEFFYQFPREIDARLGYDMTNEQMVEFARQNPSIRSHLDLQHRKMKLDDVMTKLTELTQLYQGKHPKKHQSSRWLFF